MSNDQYQVLCLEYYSYRERMDQNNPVLDIVISLYKNSSVNDPANLLIAIEILKHEFNGI